MHPNRHECSARITVVIDAQGFYRELLTLALGQSDEFEVLHQVVDFDKALRSLPPSRPKVVILDLDTLGHTEGIHMGVALRQSLPDLGILLLSEQPPSVPSHIGLKRHWSGWSYLLKPSLHSIDLFHRAVRAAAVGLLVQSSELLTLSETKQSLAHLTPRQLQILELMAEGWTNAVIARRPYMSVGSVEHQVNRIYQSLGITSENHSKIPRIQAVLKYVRETL